MFTFDGIRSLLLLSFLSVNPFCYLSQYEDRLGLKPNRQCLHPLSKHSPRDQEANPIYTLKRIQLKKLGYRTTSKTFQNTASKRIHGPDGTYTSQLQCSQWMFVVQDSNDDETQNRQSPKTGYRANIFSEGFYHVNWTNDWPMIENKILAKRPQDTVPPHRRDVFQWMKMEASELNRFLRWCLRLLCLWYSLFKQQRMPLFIQE